MSDGAMTLKNVTSAIKTNNSELKQKLTGYLNNLMTSNKDTLVDAINELFQFMVDFKTAMAESILKRGGGVIENPKDASLQDFLDAIDLIIPKDCSDATAEDIDIVEGKTAYTKTGLTIGKMKEFEPVTTAKSSRNVSGGLNASIESGCYRKIESGRSYPEIFVPNSQIASACGITASKIASGQTVAGVLGTYVGDTSTYSKIKYVEFYSGGSPFVWNIWDYIKTGTAKNQSLVTKTCTYSVSTLKFKPSKVLIEFCGYHDSFSVDSTHLDILGDRDYSFYCINIGSSERIQYRECDTTTGSRTIVDECFNISNSWDDTNKTLTVNVYWFRDASAATTHALYVTAKIRHMYFIE